MPLLSIETVPRKQRAAQVNGRGIQSVHCLLELEAKVVLNVQLPCFDQHLRKDAVNPPFSLFAGIGQSAFGNLTLNTDVVELVLHCA